MRYLLITATVIAATWFAGCAGTPPASTKHDEISHRPYYIKAQELKEQGDFALALFNLKIAASLCPADAEIAHSIEALKIMTTEEAEKHFKKGLLLYQKRSLDSARKEFLITLRYDPDHPEALTYLRATSEDVYIRYSVKPEETCQDISRNVYNDPEKDFLIAYFAASEKESPPLPGTILNLPVLDATLLMQFVDIQSDLREAKTFFQERRYDEAVAAARKILVHDPTNSAARELTRDSYCKKASALFRKRKYEEAITVAETLLAFEPTDLKASDLINASYYKMGTLLTYKQKYSEALNMYNKVAPDYHDVQKTIADLQEIMVQEAEEHYRMGVKFFVNDKFAEAIEEWEKALALNPDHKKAKSDVESTRSLLERLENLK